MRWYDGESDDNGHLRGQFAAPNDVGGDMIDEGAFTPSTALNRDSGGPVPDRVEAAADGG